MDLSFEVDLACPRRVAFAELENLDGCPEWLGVVRRVERDGDAWLVDMGARVGPLTRTKRVRMVRTVHEPPAYVCFERVEQDGREHSPWVLDATISAPATPDLDGVEETGEATEPGDHRDPGGGAACRVVLTLRYGGSSFAALLGPLLRSEAARAGPALQARIEERNHPRST